MFTVIKKMLLVQLEPQIIHPCFKITRDFKQCHSVKKLDVDFTTWSRTLKGKLKQSLLDHVYVSNFAMVENVDFEVPTFGDHVLIKVKVTVDKSCYQV